MSIKVTPEQSSCFLNWLFKYIHLKQEDCEESRSYFGLPSCLYYKGVKVHFDSELVILDCSGKGCRTLEALNPEMNWTDFLGFWYEGLTTPVRNASSNRQCPIHISRLDLACDTLDEPKTEVSRLQNYVQHNKFLCKSNYYTCVTGNHEMALYFGSPRSDRRLRIYDKALEQGIPGKLWTRFEFQLRNDNALSFILNLFNTCKGNFSQCYYGMMRDFLRFITKPNNDTNTARKITCPWWVKWLEDVAAIPQLYLPGDDYDLGQLTKFIKRECGSSIRTLLEANGGDVGELLDLVMESKINRKQKELLDSLGVDLQAMEQRAREAANRWKFQHSGNTDG